ncbi:MAG: hypothetical protein PHI72_04290 [Atribacterota bacterium]|nr:hypothetical protein [Atribacterota bacterium]MDD4895818.1 hypothetical protein [Atribacterota bacterium]MDD5636861.1 hypothetical protein [Atribacterota bacterium]
MKKSKIIMLVLFLLILFFTGFSSWTRGYGEKQASTYRSDGDSIEGWNWLRDLGFNIMQSGLLREYLLVMRI